MDSLDWQNQFYQPISIFEYSKVDDMQIEEDWLKRSPNIIDYRQKLYKAFADSQKRYLKRKAEKRIQNQVKNLIPMDNDIDYHTVDPKNTSLALRKRKLIKESRGNIRRDIERWFVIDNFLITFFKHEGDQDFKKNAPLESAFVLVEEYGEEDTQQQQYRWHERSKQYRVQIRLPQRQIVPVFYYTDDLHEAQMIASRVFMASSQKKEEISQLIKKACLIETMFRFRAIWQRVFKVYENRLLKMISFQIMGINLIELANTGWYQREKLFKFWSGQILKREKIPLLRSTFRFGEIKKKLDPSMYKSSLMVREQLRRIVNAFKNRRLQRHSAIQQDINTLLEEEEQGSQINDVTIKYFNKSGDVVQSHNFKMGNCKVDKNKFLEIDKLNDITNADFFERNPPFKFLLEHISQMSTNCNQFDKSQETFKLRIFGRNTNEVNNNNIQQNLSPHEIGFDILRRQPKEIYQIKVHSIELPIKLASKFSLKADLRVRVKQAKTLDLFETSAYYINSRPYRISVPPNRDKGRMVIKGYDYTFTIDKLDPANPDEVFQLYIVLQRNNVPLTQFMKEFLYEEEFQSKKYFTFEQNDNLEAKVSDDQGNKMKIKFSLSKINNDGTLYPNEREGKRVMVGRYALYRRRIVIIKQINRDQTVNIQYLLKPDRKEQNVQISKLKLIERHGVNVYDINNQPYQVENSQYQWILEFNAVNKRLINIINSSIQNRQVFNSFEQRNFFREIKRDIEGKILLSVIEVISLKQKNCNPYVKISVINMNQTNNDEVNYQEEFYTSVKDNNSTPNWMSSQHPSGELFNLGNFFKEDQKGIKFELINKRYGQDVEDQQIGEVTLTVQDFINIDNPGTEKCIILENKKDQSYIFLVVQSLFVSNNVTRIEYQLTKDLSIFVSPEQYFHYMYLQEQYEIDDFYFPIPLNTFYPNYLEKQLIKIKESNDNNNNKQSQLIYDQASSPMKACAPGISLINNKLTSPEEKLSIQLKYRNMSRPEIEEGVMIFKYLWKHRVFVSRQRAFTELQNKFWVKFIFDMGISAAAHPYVHILRDDDNDGNVNQDFDKTSIKTQNQNQGGNQIMDWFKQKAQINNNDYDSRQQFSTAQQKTAKFKLMFNRIWENETGQQYADTYYLIQSGIPSELRVKIWKDLLRSEVLQFEETVSFKKNYLEYYNEKLSIYENLKEYAYRQDCLAFRQIDEDIEYYRFPKLFHEGDIEDNKVATMREDKSKMRNILRVLIFWSRNKNFDNRIISYSYNKGILHILQRLITFANEEDSFWILNGFIRAIPRLFSTEVSCLEGGRNSAMRNEMTAFKAILRENLPLICDKLRLLGLPVDMLIYDSMTSFYSHFFSSEVVLRLWDQIIFNFANSDKIARKRALWYFMAPAYLILREKQEDIMNAHSIQQVLDLYSNGCALTYSPDWVVNELKILIKDIFVTGIERFQEAGQSKLSLGFNRIMKSNQVDKAQLLEQTRKNYEADLSLIFNSIEEENKQIGILLEKTNFGFNPKNPQYLDYVKWRNHVMARFKKVALKNNGDDMYDDLFEYEEPEMNRDNMDLSKINIYLHQVSNLSGVRLFKLRLLYGRIVPDLQVLEERFSDDVFNDPNINQYHAFEYMNGYNQIKIEILDNQNDDNVVCELIVDLRELNCNKFIKKHYQMRNEYFVENLDSYRNPFTVFMISFFLQSHTTHQHNELMQERNTSMSQFINSIKRKLPDRIDIFNKKNENEFVQMMKGDFKRIIREEFEALSNFLPEQQARNTINDNFNYIEDSDFGNITLDNLQFLVKQCFFNDWLPYLNQLYKIFVKEEEEKKDDDQLVTEENLNEDELNDSVNGEEKKGFNVFSKIKDTLMKKPQSSIQSKPQSVMQRKRNFELEGRVTMKERTKLPFSLRNFIVSLVLMSHCTVNEKFDILYDLFDWNDGVADGLDMNAMFMLIKTIFERNLYYWPSHELFNLVEMAFDLSVSSIYQVFWTRESFVQPNKKSTKLKDLLLMKPQQLKASDELMTIDVTDEMLENINSYQRMFGTKIIDFNNDSSAFKNIDNLIKGGQKLIEITNQLGGKYRLVIFYQVSSERYLFEVEYDDKGMLTKNKELDEKDDIDEYLKRNINKLYLSGRSQGISKKEFLLKTEQIPFLQDLIRVETLYRDRFQSTLQRKKKLEQELIVLINEEDMMFVFRFQSRVMSNVEGDIQMIDKSTYRILMTEAYEQDTVSDIRFRINKIMQNLSKKEKQITDQHLLHLKGVKEFFLKDENSIKWKLVNEYDRLIEFKKQQQTGGQSTIQQKEIILKMEFTKHQGQDIFMSSKEEERDLAGFDCYSLYKHNDNSYEWRLCKIMQKEPIVENKGVNGLLGRGAADLDVLNKNEFNQQKFYYWIEFLHHRKTGQKLWLKRRREEILMSARYAREQQRNYEQETLKFIREAYQGEQNSKNQKFNSSPKNKMQQIDSVKKNLHNKY